jgi:aspartyl aminopeptidase
MTPMSLTDFNQNLLTFLDNSPTPFHTVSVMAEQLDTSGFKRLSEVDMWGDLAVGR